MQTNQVEYAHVFEYIDNMWPKLNTRAKTIMSISNNVDLDIVNSFSMQSLQLSTWPIKVIKLQFRMILMNKNGTLDTVLINREK